MADPILHVLDYFSIFKYPPTVNEVYTFLNRKKSRREFNKRLDLLINKNVIKQNNSRLALSKGIFNIFKQKQKLSEYYFFEAEKRLALLKCIPFIQYLGISGSLSMKNMSTKGDIDVFIITSENTIWTTRFLVLIYKILLRFIHKTIAKKFCFNLFFSKAGLQIPLKKQNEYIGHELLQLKTTINKNNTYESLLLHNMWLKNIFPNTKINKKVSGRFHRLENMSVILTFIELVLRRTQLWWLTRKHIIWQEKKGQLWLIQEDFEWKIKRRIY